jgi:ornithine cyclodeaminase
MAKTTLLALASACPDIDTVKVKGRGKASLDGFIAWLKDALPRVTNVSVVDDCEAVVRHSDIVAFCSSGPPGDISTYPLVKREWVKRGAFLAMPSLCDIDDGMIAADVRKVVDNSGLYEAWFEELPKPAHLNVPLIGVKFMDLIAEGRMARNQLEDLGAIVAGAAPGRTDDDQIIIMSVGGMAVEDVAWGTVVYRNAVAKGIGVTLNLWNEAALR